MLTQAEIGIRGKSLLLEELWTNRISSVTRIYDHIPWRSWNFYRNLSDRSWDHGRGGSGAWIVRRYNLFREKEGKHPCSSPTLYSSAFYHWTYLEVNRARKPEGCTFQNKRRLGNECAHTSCSGPAYLFSPSSSHCSLSCMLLLYPSNLISVPQYILFVLSVFVTPNLGGGT